MTKYRYKRRGVRGYLARFFLWLYDEPWPKAPPDDSKGARFATEDEIAALHQPHARESMGFGHTGGPLFLKTDKHVLIMASTRRARA